MKTTAETLIKERTYSSLTAEELLEVNELCANEAEFLSMQQFYRQIDQLVASETTLINPEIKTSLDAIYAAKFPGIRGNWNAPEAVTPAEKPVIPLYQRTWVRVAAVGLLLIGTIPFWRMFSDEHTVLKQQPLAGVQQPKKQSEAGETTTINADTATQQYNTRVETQPGNEPVMLAAEARGTYRTVSAPHFESEISAAPASESVLMEMTHFSSETTDNVVGALELTNGFSAAYSDQGRIADLYPDAVDEEIPSYASLSMAAQPADLFDLLVPAF